MKRFLWASLLAAVLSIGGAIQAMAFDTAIVFILDASGSMWARVEGAPKIVTAKSALKELVSAVSGDAEMGLVAYGHRRKGDCDDIERVMPLGSPPQRILSAIDALSPKGKTPISKALTAAGESLNRRESEATIVLVSDGIETCDADPCATMAALKAKGLKVIVHVIGFDVNAAAADQLTCIAEAGGGRFFNANDIAALKSALQTVGEAAVEKKPLPPPPPAAALPSGSSTSKKVRIAGPGKAVLKPAAWVAMPPRYWALADAETGERKARGTTPELRVRAGDYQVVWRQSEHGHADVYLNEVVRVKSGQTVEVPIDTGIRLSVPQGFPAPKWWGLAEPAAATPHITYGGTLAPQVCPTGTYRLMWRQSEHGSATVALADVALTAGTLNEVVIDRGLVLQPAEWLNAKPYYYSLTDKNGRQVARWRELGPQLAPPGEYTLVYRPSQHGHSDIVWGQITIAEHGLTQVPLNSGIQFIHQPQARPPYRIYFVDIDHQQEFTMASTWDPMPLPPGRYRIDWHETEHGHTRETIVEQFEVTPGTLVEMEM